MLFVFFVTENKMAEVQWSYFWKGHSTKTKQEVYTDFKTGLSRQPDEHLLLTGVLFSVNDCEVFW
jgi:hypothetical protein